MKEPASTAVAAASPIDRAAWAWLFLAIASGASGTSALSQAKGFALLPPTLLAVACYALCFLALTRAVRSIPVSVAYAVWSGVGIALVSVIGWALFGQSLGLGELLGIGLILVGTVVIQLFSRTAKGGA